MVRRTPSLSLSFSPCLCVLVSLTRYCVSNLFSARADNAAHSLDRHDGRNRIRFACARPPHYCLPEPRGAGAQTPRFASSSLFLSRSPSHLSLLYFISQSRSCARETRCHLSTKGTSTLSGGLTSQVRKTQRPTTSHALSFFLLSFHTLYSVQTHSHSHTHSHEQQK